MLPQCIECGDDADLFFPGTEPRHSAAGGILFDKGESVRAFCLRCAVRRGWLKQPDDTSG